MGFWQWVRFGLVNAAFLIFAAIGLTGGIFGWIGAESVGQQAVAIARIIYAVAAAGALWALWRQSWWLTLSLLIWGVIMTAAAAFAPVAFRSADWITGAFSGLVTAGVALLVGWMSFAHATWKRRSKGEYVSYYS